jgi:hypothetical protein
VLTAMRVERLAAALAVFVAIVACDPILPSSSSDVEAPTVLVVGDSLVEQANGNAAPGESGPLTAALVEAGYEAEVHATFGLKVATTDPWTWSSWRPEDVDVLVIALGTNDMRIEEYQFGDLEVARSRIQGWFDEAPDACSVSVEINEGGTAWGLDDTAPSYNAMLRDISDRTVPWDPEPPEVELLFGREGVHADTEVGREAYREAIVRGVQACDASR